MIAGIVLAVISVVLVAIEPVLNVTTGQGILAFRTMAIVTGMLHDEGYV